MFNTGMTKDQVEAFEAYQIQVAATLGAIAGILIGKGITTQEELLKVTSILIAQFDQKMSRQKEEQIAEFDKQHPGFRKLFGKVFGFESEAGS